MLNDVVALITRRSGARLITVWLNAAWAPASLRETKRINPARWVISVLIDVDPAREPDRVLTNEAPRVRIVIPMPVIVQPCLLVSPVTAPVCRTGTPLAAQDRLSSPEKPRKHPNVHLLKRSAPRWISDPISAHQSQIHIRPLELHQESAPSLPFLSKPRAQFCTLTRSSAQRDLGILDHQNDLTSSPRRYISPTARTLDNPSTYVPCYLLSPILHGSHWRVPGEPKLFEIWINMHGK